MPQRAWTTRGGPALDTSDSDGTVSTDMVRILLGGAPLQGGELAKILASAGLEPALLDRSQKRIPTRHLAIIWTEMERAADDLDLGLHLGESIEGLPSGHVLFAAMLNSPTLGHALARYCRFHDIMGDFVQPQLDERGGTTVLTLAPRRGVKLHRQHVEFIFSFVVSVLRQLGAAPCRGQARFAHERPVDIAEHRRIFGATPEFAHACDELAIEAGYLARPIKAADSELLRALDQYAERLLSKIRPALTWSTRVTEVVSRTLCDGKPRLANVARRLGVSSRSLQGKLKAEGTSYQTLLDNARKQLATAYLDDGELSLTEIAFLLGFADQSAFNHAFRGWTGDTPLGYRQRPRRRT